MWYRNGLRVNKIDDTRIVDFTSLDDVKIVDFTPFKYNAMSVK